jgi:tetratricopeptide (TPR) repeat protein
MDQEVVDISKFWTHWVVAANHLVSSLGSLWWVVFLCLFTILNATCCHAEPPRPHKEELQAPLSPDGLCELAVKAKKVGDREKASELLEKALDLDPQHYLTVLNLAVLEFEDQNNSDCLRHLSLALQLNPYDPAVRYWLQRYLLISRCRKVTRPEKTEPNTKIVKRSQVKNSLTALFRSSTAFEIDASAMQVGAGVTGAKEVSLGRYVFIEDQHKTIHQIEPLAAENLVDANVPAWTRWYMQLMQGLYSDWDKRKDPFLLPEKGIPAGSVQLNVEVDSSGRVNDVKTVGICSTEDHLNYKAAIEELNSKAIGAIKALSDCRSLKVPPQQDAQRVVFSLILSADPLIIPQFSDLSWSRKVLCSSDVRALRASHLLNLLAFDEAASTITKGVSKAARKLAPCFDSAAGRGCYFPEKGCLLEVGNSHLSRSLLSEQILQIVMECLKDHRMNELDRFISRIVLAENTDEAQSTITQFKKNGTSLAR